VISAMPSMRPLSAARPAEERIFLNSSPPEIIDTHAHICDAIFDSDRKEMLARAQAAGISTVIAVGEDLSDARSGGRALSDPS